MAEPSFFDRFIDLAECDFVVVVHGDGRVEMRGNGCPLDLAKTLALATAKLIANAHSHDDEHDDGPREHGDVEPGSWVDRDGRVWEPIGMHDALGDELLRTAGETDSYPLDALRATFGPLHPYRGDGS
ncbi:phiSA1p31-related protein [Actinacidiphila glaucinigra]|uniref:phiSA1p31-related protein n=1 Tax=Actinacidiphila glaucinigra TaxID=235986 RepID=UPI0035E28207